jgi:uncharacterized protein
MAGEASMDDILASIRRMIAEEPIGSRAGPVPSAPAPKSPAQPQAATAPALEPVAPSWGALSADRSFGPAIGPQAGALPRVDPDRNAAFPIAKDDLAALIDDTLEKPVRPLVRPSDAAQPASASAAPMTLPLGNGAPKSDEPSLTDRLLERLGAGPKPAQPLTAPTLEPQTASTSLALDRPPLFAEPPLTPSADARLPDLGAVRPEPLGTVKAAEPTLATLLKDEPAAPRAEAAPPPPFAAMQPSQRAVEPMPAPLPMPGAPQPALAPASLATAMPRSLEDTIAEMLKPMLKTWLDQNLPRVVEKVVREQLAARDGAAPKG